MKTDKLHEECAVFGMSSHSARAADTVYCALVALQHRGQEGCGIAVNGARGSIECRKARGLVSDVFSADTLAALPPSRSAIGHCRYSTTGSDSKKNVQPFVTEYLTGRIATAHNGNITNARELRELLSKQGAHFEATSDSEVLSTLIAYCILREKDVLRGIVRAAEQLEGAFSLVLLCDDGKIVALRDANGFRPLCIGSGDAGSAVASESCALDSCGIPFLRDVAPGELVVLDRGEICSEGIVLKNRTPGFGMCIFEYVYFSRPDSIIDGLSVYRARFNMGRTLAIEHPADADVVCGVPDSGLDAAAGFAAESGIPLVPGFVKNRYIGRSFIYPSQAQREAAVRLKLSPLGVNISGKRVVLVDDSIVRGTTSEKIVRNLRAAGAKEIHFRVSSPPFTHTCLYGTDIDREENLIANNMSIDDIRRKIGVDSLGYISIKGLKTACAECRLPFCTRCFTGDGAAQTASVREGTACQGAACQGAACQGAACQGAAREGTACERAACESAACQGAAREGAACKRAACEGAACKRAGREIHKDSLESPEDE